MVFSRLRSRLPGFGTLPLTAGRLAFDTIAVVSLSHVVFSYAFTISPTFGTSMAPTMSVIGDFVLISKVHRRGRNVSVGDVISYEHPFCRGRTVIKRIVGMPGDFVLRDTPGAVGSEGLMVQIPEGHCFVAGDNQKNSRDSRLHGPVPLALVRGKVVARVMPFREMKWFENTLTEPLDEDELD